MDHITQPSPLDLRDAGRIDAVVAADAAQAQEPVAVEYGSGWYHDAEIEASARTSEQKH